MVFLQSIAFKAGLESSGRTRQSQETIADNTSGAVATQSRVVVSKLKNANLLVNVEVTPTIFTPNSDGIND